jgi:hypothetical protein
VFFAIAAARKARALAAGVESLYEAWLLRLGRPRADASSRRIASRLAAEPIITVARVAAFARVSNTAADNAVRKLEAAGSSSGCTRRSGEGCGRLPTSSGSSMSSSASSPRQRAPRSRSVQRRG